MAYNSLMVFTGNANPKLAADVAQQLNVDLGRANVGRFSDGEVSVELQEHVRGRDVFVLQSTCAPTNDNLMELLVMVDALKRASAGRITAAIPYFGYARQDRRSRSSRVPITAKVVANMLVGLRRRPRADRGPARRPDPGLLRHSGRQHLRPAHAARRHPEAELREPAGRLAGPRRRRPRPLAGQAPRMRPGDHRQASRRRPTSPK